MGPKKSLFRFLPLARILRGGASIERNRKRIIIVGKEDAVKKTIVMMLFLALFAAMAMPVAGIGPVQVQACGIDKGPPPPG